jgi:hypothetical protein
MITLESAIDILDANKARVAALQQPLLTNAGRTVLTRLVKILKPIPQTEIDAIIRGSLTDKDHTST